MADIDVRYWGDEWAVPTYTVLGVIPQMGPRKGGSWVAYLLDKNGRHVWFCLMCQSLGCECVQVVKRADAIRRGQ